MLSISPILSRGWLDGAYTAQRGPPPQVLGQRVPYGNRSGLRQAAHLELVQPSLPSQGIDAFRGRGPIFVGFLGLVRPHAGSPFGKLWRFARAGSERVLSLGPLLLLFFDRGIDLISLLGPIECLNVTIGGVAAIGQHLRRPHARAILN